VVNERDGLGDNTPFDYATHVQEGAFYGWPWYYIGGHEDPRHKGEHTDLKDKITIPDVLIQAHSAALQIVFYAGADFPAEYKGNAFVTLHGSWDRSRRTGVAGRGAATPAATDAEVSLERNKRVRNFKLKFKEVATRRALQSQNNVLNNFIFS
jgi:glucose/arabinose dehydrogenase